MYCNVVHVFMLVGVSTESILTFIWLHVRHYLICGEHMPNPRL